MRKLPDDRADPCTRCGSVDWFLGISKVGTRWWRCRGCHTEALRKKRERFPHEKSFDNAKQRARARDLPFTITKDDVKEMLAPGRCAFCDALFIRGERHIRNASLDQLVPGAGYTKENTVAACMQCNARKGTASPPRLRELADSIEQIIYTRSKTKGADESCGKYQCDAGVR